MTLGNLSLLLAIIAGGVLRIKGIETSLNHDEAFTVEAFASYPYSHIFTSYPAPNNHILHSALVRFSTQLFGVFEWTIRLPAVLAGIGAVPALWLLCQRIFPNTLVAPVASWLLALTPTHIVYSQQARGYSLLILFSILSFHSLYSAICQHNGRRWISWAGFAGFGFLAAQVMPTGAIMAIALVGWSLIVIISHRRYHMLQIIFCVAAVMVVAIGLVYLPVHQAIHQMADRWAVDVWSEPIAALQILTDVLVLCAGGWWGLIPGIAALLGLAFMARRNAPAFYYVVVIWSAPVLAGAFSGLMGEARGYLFALPTIYLAAAVFFSVVARTIVSRILVMAALVGGYLWACGVSLLTEENTEDYRALSQYLSENSASGDIIVSPEKMDIEVWSYAKETIRDRLIDVLQEKRINRLLFLANSADHRVRLPNYILRTNLGPQSLKLPLDSYYSKYDGNPLQVYQLLSESQVVFPQGIRQWKFGNQNNKQVIGWSVTGPAVSDDVTIGIENPKGLPFQLFSKDTFVPNVDGWIILAYAKTEPKSFAQMYEVAGTEVTRHHLFKTASWPAVIQGKDGKVWHLEAYLLPANASRRYGIYLLGGGVPRQQFGDFVCFFFPADLKTKTGKVNILN